MLPAITAKIVPHHEGSSDGLEDAAPEEANSAQEIRTGTLLAWNPGLPVGSAPVRRVLIEGGRILSFDPAVGDLERGSLLVVEGRIAEVGAEVDAADAEREDANE